MMMIMNLVDCGGIVEEEVVAYLKVQYYLSIEMEELRENSYTARVSVLDKIQVTNLVVINHVRHCSIKPIWQN
jgi:hypothetical protein